MAHSAFSKQQSPEDANRIVEVTVQPGDTMWEIALEHKPEESDTREFMYEIAAMNGVKDCNIISGQVLKIPSAK